MDVATEPLYRQHKAAANGFATPAAIFFALVGSKARIAYGFGRIMLVRKDARARRNDIETETAFEAVAFGRNSSE